MNQTIFVLLDACQYGAGTRNLGFLEHMIDYDLGAKYKVRGQLPSLSRPMYATLLSGLPAYRHGITTNEVSRRLTVDNVFSLCKASGGKTAAAAYCWVSELYGSAPFDPVRDRMHLTTRGDIDAGIYYWEDEYPDTHLFADGEFLRRQFKPDFLMCHSMGIDGAGHKKGAETAEYEAAIMTADHALAILLPQWLEEGYQVVITADHGMNRFGLHGGTDAEQRDVPLYVFSEQVKAGRFESGYYSQLNVAPLLCRLLGIPAAEGMLRELEIRFKE